MISWYVLVRGVSRSASTSTMFAFWRLCFAAVREMACVFAALRAQKFDAFIFRVGNTHFAGWLCRIQVISVGAYQRMVDLRAVSRIYFACRIIVHVHSVGAPPLKER